MAGLLDFFGTPQGQGLLSAVAGGLAGARRGTPLNNIGRGLLAGTAGYSQGLDRQTQEQQLAMQQRERDQMNELRGLQMSQARMGLEREQGQQAWRQGLPDVMKQATEASYGASDAGPTMTPANPDALKKYAMLPNSPFADDILKQTIMPKESSYKTVGSTMIRIGANGEVIPVFTAPQKPESAPSAVKEYEYAKGQGYQGSFQQFQTEMKRAGASNVNVPINMGQKGFDNTLKLRGDFRSEPIYKAQQEMETSYAQIREGLNKASPAGDLAGATKIMKLLDPGSVVRESELGMAMAASGALDRLSHYATNVINGTKLTPDQRKDFQSLADALYSESVKQYNAKRGEYAGIAERNQLSVEDVVGKERTAPNKPKPQKRVVRTGTLNGKKVVEYEDGSVDYAD
jgi:hypothetical protein